MLDELFGSCLKCSCSCVYLKSCLVTIYQIPDVGNPDPPAWSELSWLRSRRWNQEQGWRETSQVRQSRGGSARPGLLATPESRELGQLSEQQTGGAWAGWSHQASSGQVLALDCSLPGQEVIPVPALSHLKCHLPLRGQILASRKLYTLSTFPRGKREVLHHSWRIISVRRIKDWVSRKAPLIQFQLILRFYLSHGPNVYVCNHLQSCVSV